MSEGKCRCINVPKGSSFVKDNYYEWCACIDGYCVWDSEDNEWYFGEIGFYIHFQIIQGGGSKDNEENI